MRHTWEDLVEDFLEVACRMNARQRELALECLRLEGVEAEHLEVHPAFSLEGKMMIILRGAAVSRCAVYFVESGKIETLDVGKLVYR